MNDPKNFINTVCSPESTQIDGFDSLAALAFDLRWSWNHNADDLWQMLDPELWQLTHNPWLLLQSISGERLRQQLGSPDFRSKLDALIRERMETDSTPAWFQQNYSGATLSTVAYFSMEFMLSEALPIYVGGLGNVAGDQLKSASDLGIPVVGIGLLYQQGYFRQSIDANGEQQAYLPYNDPGQLPVKPLRLPNGEWLRIQISLRGYPVWLRAWQVQVGRVHLYLLDSNDAANLPTHREITGQLYGGASEMRIRQEIVLGIGGWRLLETLGIRPEVCHLNEGHAAFAVLDRARSFMQESGQSFEAALAATRAGNLFTTHTAVAAGFDHFEPWLMADYFKKYAEDELRISLDDLLGLGRQYPGDASESFNMAYLAIRGSGGINGVSSLHGRVSRHLFEPLFSRWPTEEVPVGSVTNGVHMPSWDSEASDAVWTEACGKDRWRGTTEGMEAAIMKIPDPEIWAMRTKARHSLIGYVRERIASQFIAEGADAGKIGQARTIFDPNILTIGFARRFVAYKRPDLLLRDPDRLVRMLTNTDRPVQLLIAGKAPPADQSGKDLIKQWIQFIHRTGTSRHVLFLEDYDMLLAEHLVGGMDVWLNTPQRPWEASGTSGMKVLVNGGLNLSELDGWWVEAYAPDVGWAIGDGQEHGDDPAWDAVEADALYTLLEREIVPEFYQRDETGIPRRWVARMRESMTRLTPQYSANRTVREYTANHYVPAAAAFAARAAQKGGAAAALVSWRQKLATAWNGITMGPLTARNHAGRLEFEVPVYLGELDPDAVRVELFANGRNGDGPFLKAMDRTAQLPGNGYLYSAGVEDNRNAADFTPRVIPYRPDAAVPLEARQIFWQK